VIEQIQNEDKVDVGEWFFTSGEDRIFPKGFPVGRVVSAEPGQGMKNVALNLSGAPGGADEVLVVLKGIHQPIPAAPVAENTPVTTLMAPAPELETEGAETPKPQTAADKIVQKYAEIGKQENHVYGGVGSAIPNFNAKPASTPKQTPAPATTPAAPKTATNTTAAAPNRPAILGARPNAPAAGQTTKPEPVLPLGAPRRRPPASEPTNPPQ
jgi:rod shape-determining protein MreC